MATTEKRVSHGKIVYYVKVRRKGTPLQAATFTRLADAQRRAKVTEAAVIEHRYVPIREKHTLGELLDRYGSDVLAKKRWSTARPQRIQLAWWKTQLGDHDLADVTPAVIARQRDLLSRGGRSPATVNRYLAALSHCFTVAVREWQWVTENPVLKVRRPKEPRGRVRFLSDQERQRLLDACRASQDTLISILWSS